jgi:hypothetical protein
MTTGWTVLRIRGDRGMPALDSLQFLSCISGIRESLGDRRWHYVSKPDRNNGLYDGLRVEVPFRGPGQDRVKELLEMKIPPPDSVVAEPMHLAADLDGIQDEAEMDAFLTLLWRHSEFIADLRARNPHVTLGGFMNLTGGAFLAFVTGSRRHLDIAMEREGFHSVPTVGMGRLLSLLQGAPIPYRIPPRDHEEAVSAARIHHLAGCTFASGFYPFTQS